MFLIFLFLEFSELPPRRGGRYIWKWGRTCWRKRRKHI